MTRTTSTGAGTGKTAARRNEKKQICVRRALSLAGEFELEGHCGTGDSGVTQRNGRGHYVLAPGDAAGGRLVNHTHEYAYFHGHMHLHDLERKGHNHGHCHLFAQTHDHGEGGRVPHSHKARQYHPGDEAVEHHKGEEA